MVMPICKFCEANAGHNQQLRLLKVKWGTFRQGCSPLLFYMLSEKVTVFGKKSFLLQNRNS
jgi:hypothetical protein